MSAARHRAPARHRAARPARERLRRIAVVAGLPTAATAAVVAAGVTVGVAPDPTLPSSREVAGSLGSAVGTLDAADVEQMTADRQQRVSRTASRVVLRPEAVGTRFATADLNVWTEPAEKGRKLRVVDWGTKLRITGKTQGHWAEILVAKDVVRWVNSDYLAKTKPKPEATASTGAATSGISTAACAAGSSVESGLTSSAVAVYRAVCAAFPAVSSYGGYSPRGEHYDGRAIDIMVSGAYGQQIADWLRANASTLNLRDVIYAQRIWTPDRAAEGWRYMSDRGSATANHYDHVHVAVY